jgi:hypothetical protein
MLSGIIGLIFAMLLMIFGFAGLRRSLAALTEHDPIGKRILAAKGERFTLIAYRVYGAAFVLLGMAMAYLSLGLLRAQ